MAKKPILLPMVVWFVVFAAPALEAGGSFTPSQMSQSSSSPFGIQRLQEKKEAPPFCLKTLNGGKVSLSDYQGRLVLLVFWATWCPSCVEELPLLEKFMAGNKDQLTVLTLAIDGEKEKRIQRIVNENQITLPVLLDVKEKIARIYGVKFVPAAFLINREGLIVGKIIGERDWTSPEAWPSIKEVLW